MVNNKWGYEGVKGLRPRKATNVIDEVVRNCSECGHQLTVYETSVCDVCILERNGGEFPQEQKDNG